MYLFSLFKLFYTLLRAICQIEFSSEDDMCARRTCRRTLEDTDSRTYKSISKQPSVQMFFAYSSTVIVSVGDEVAHAMPCVHSSFHTGTDFWLSGYSGRSCTSKRSTGHTSTQLLSPLHFFKSTLTSGIFHPTSFNFSFVLSSRSSVERNVFPENVPPIFLCYGFSLN